MGRSLSWRRLEALIGDLVVTPGTRTHVAMGGSEWTLLERLLAAAVDVLAVANWQRQGKKGAPRPKPISPQGQPDSEQATDTAGRSQEEIDRLLDGMRTGAFSPGG